MRIKQFVAGMIAVAAAVTLLSGCGGSSKNVKSKDDKASGYDQITYAYATFNNIPSKESLADVQEAINKITREKIHTEVTLEPISIADYSSKVSLALQGGEKLDVFQSLGDFNNAVATDMALDITEMLDEDAPEAKQLIGDTWLSACAREGHIYGLPTYKPVALTPMVIYRQDIADKLDIDMTKVSSLEDMTDVLRKVKTAEPQMTPLAPVQTGEIGLATNYGDVDFLTDDRYAPIGVLQGNSTEVKDLYETDLFKSRCNLVHQWYENGLVMKDAATTTSAAAELMNSGNYFCYIAAYSYPEADTAASLGAQIPGYKIGARMIGDAYLTTGDINAVTWMISSTSKTPDAALKFLNLTFSDADVVNLLIYGIEGRDYVKHDDGTVGYPEGVDAANVPYTAQLSVGTLGNFFKMYPQKGTNPQSLDWEMKQNKEAKTSPAMGFTFDSSQYSTQYTAVKNVLTQYLPGLTCGSLNPETEIPKFKAALKDAGYQEILAAKQEQLSKWVKDKK